MQYRISVRNDQKSTMVGDVWEEAGRVAIGDGDSRWAVGDSGQVEGGSDYIEESKGGW